MVHDSKLDFLISSYFIFPSSTCNNTLTPTLGFIGASLWFNLNSLNEQMGILGSESLLCLADSKRAPTGMRPTLKRECAALELNPQL